MIWVAITLGGTLPLYFALLLDAATSAEVAPLKSWKPKKNSGLSAMLSILAKKGIKALKQKFQNVTEHN